MSDSPVLLAIESLQPHPQNPRVIKREDIINAIYQQIRAASSFDVRHAITVRAVNGHYEILSGHNRTEAAMRAGEKQIPAWIREMDDEHAFMELILSNAQGELSPLERGLHALNATEKGQHGKSIAGYAVQVGRRQQTVSLEVCAARVAKSYQSTGNLSALSDKCSHLAEIHVAPETCWSALVERMLKHDWTVKKTAEHVAEIGAVKSPRGHEKLFSKITLQEMLAAGKNIDELTGTAVRTITRARADVRNGFEPTKFSEDLERWLAEHGPWDEMAIFAHVKQLLDAQKEAQLQTEHKVANLKRAVPLTEWNTLTASEQQAILQMRDDNAKLKQDGTSSEWARWSWNPIMGCLHNCPYCYARDIAERVYAQKFEPSIFPNALAAPLNVMPPKEAALDPGWKSILTCSMADLFGGWVPAEWIEAVFTIMRQAPQWNFLLLTKFPARLKEFQFPDNVWPGVSVDLQARVPAAEDAIRDVKARVRWLSIEPLLEPITIDFSLFNWVVIGGASESSRTPDWKPPRRWVHDLTSRALAAGCVAYHKETLNLDRLRDYVGFAEPELSQAPGPFQYLTGDKRLHVVETPGVTKTVTAFIDAGERPDTGGDR